MPVATKKSTKSTKKNKVKTPEEPVSLEAKLGPATAMDTAGTRIKAVAHGFRLRFNGLSRQRQFDKATKVRLAEHIDMSADNIGASKKLYGAHPALTRVQTAKTALLSMFSANTLPYPEHGVRLFPVRSSEEAQQQAEVREFISQIRNKIDEFTYAVENLADNWDYVIQSAREKLQSQFNPAEYPEQSAVKSQLTVTMETYNFKLPAYLKSVDPEEYKRQVAILQGKFEEAAKLQETAFLAAFNKSVSEFLNSVGSFHAKDSKRFSDSAVTKVLGAVRGFQDKCARFGILNDAAMNTLIDDLRRAMTAGGLVTSPAAIAKELRNSTVSRQQMLQGVQSIHERLLTYASEVPSRKLCIGEDG